MKLITHNSSNNNGNHDDCRLSYARNLSSNYTKKVYQLMDLMLLNRYIFNMTTGFPTFNFSMLFVTCLCIHSSEPDRFVAVSY